MNQGQESILTESKVPPQILLMEDESSVANGLKMILTEEGYGVDMAITGQGALDTLTHKEFNLLVADLRLPDMDGMDVIKRIKDESPETEVIVITGYGNVPSAVEAIKTGVVGYLSKPFTDEEFKAAVEDALKEKQEDSRKKYFKPDETEKEKLIRKKEVVQVLSKVTQDDDFLTDLLQTEDKFILALIDLETYAPSSEVHDSISPIEEKRKDTSEELARTFDFQKNLIESSTDGILGCDKEGKIVTFNKSMEKMLGYSKEEVFGKKYFYEFFPPGDAERLKEELNSEGYGGKNRLCLFENNLITKEGNRIPIQLSATVLFEEDEEMGMVSFFRDLREIKKLEQQFGDQARLLHQDKMMSLGRLAASVVHEINNPLTGILNYIRLMIKILKRGSLVKDNLEKFNRYLELIENETDRCSKIVSNLLAFSRKSKLEFSEMDINELLEKCIMLSQHKLALQNIQIKTDLGKEIPKIEGDFNQIQQCVINLIFNAIDAMPAGGSLSIESSYNEKEKLVRIKVMDTGCGIAKEEISNIFDPFYTTKKEGEGIGLGLSTVYSIIDHHKGTISVDSELGEGSVFTIKLPVGGTGM